MTITPPQNLFREKALEKAASPERLDQDIQIIKSYSWIPLAALGSLVVAGLTWSVVGRIPITALGQGVLVYPSTVVDFQAASSGQLLETTVKVGDSVKKGDVLATIDQAELQKQLQQEQTKLADLQAQDQVANSLQRQRSAIEQGALEQQRLSLQQQLESAALLTPTLQSRLERRRWLLEQGAVSEDTVLEAQQAYQESATKVPSLQAQLQQIDVQLKGQVEQNYTASVSRQNQIQNVKRAIAQLELQLQKNSQVISQHNGQILEIAATPGQALSPGIRIGTIAAQNSNSTLVGVTFFPDSDGKKLQPGMPVEITPTTVKRERFGGIMGTVTDISAFPVTKEGVNRLIGNPEVTQALLAKGPQIQVFANLQPDMSTYSKFKWSSSQGPQLKVSAGTSTTVRVTVEERAPITFVLPILRSWSGLS
jgi:HlyD family secretion protein